MSAGQRYDRVSKTWSRRGSYGENRAGVLLLRPPKFKQGALRLLESSDLIRESGLKPGFEVLGQEIIASSPEVSNKLNLRTRDPIQWLQRLMRVNSFSPADRNSLFHTHLLTELTKIDIAIHGSAHAVYESWVSNPSCPRSLRTGIIGGMLRRNNWVWKVEHLPYGWNTWFLILPKHHSHTSLFSFGETDAASIRISHTVSDPLYRDEDMMGIVSTSKAELMIDKEDLKTNLTTDIYGKSRWFIALLRSFIRNLAHPEICFDHTLSYRISLEQKSQEEATS